MPHRKALVLALLLAIAGYAETVRGNRNIVTNRDVVALAKAGFDENFIITTILTSHTRFDTRVPALAKLAQQGLSEGVIRAMVNAAARPVGMYAAAPDAPPAPLAVQYQQSTLFWGLWKRRLGLAPAPAPAPGPIPHLGPLYEPNRPRGN